MSVRVRLTAAIAGVTVGRPLSRRLSVHLMSPNSVNRRPVELVWTAVGRVP